MTIVDQMQTAVNSGQTIQQAIDEIVPGADPVMWERILNNRSKPKTRKAKPRKERQSTPRFAKCNQPGEILGRINGSGHNNNDKTIWDLLQEKVQSQEIAVTPDQPQVIWSNEKVTVEIRRRKTDDSIVLVFNTGRFPIQSKPVLKQKKDHTSLNGMTGSSWQEAFMARQNYEEWVKDCGGQR